MPLSRTESHLLALSKARKQKLESLHQGARIVEDTGRPLKELKQQVCADRVALAEQFAAAGDRLLRTRPPEYRSAISRYYYSMYHAMRAVVYYVNDGDDHEQHSELPRHTPSDFKDSAIWENNLKDARGRRNDADYDPYPLQHAEFRAAARTLRQHSHELIPLVRSYLQSKGCGYV